MNVHHAPFTAEPCSCGRVHLTFFAGNRAVAWLTLTPGQADVLCGEIMGASVRLADRGVAAICEDAAA